MRKKTSNNQLSLTFTFHNDHLVYAPPYLTNLQESEILFAKLVDGSWSVDITTEENPLFSADPILAHLTAKLAYPEIVKIAHVHHSSPHFVGFSAIYKQVGLIFLNAASDLNTKNYYSYLLTSTLGLTSMYKDKVLLGERAEKLVFEKLLPSDDVKSFFYERITSIPPIVAANISEYFKVPFEYVLKRALQLQFITPEQYTLLLPVAKQIKHIKPSTELYVTQPDEDYSDESQLRLFE